MKYTGCMQNDFTAHGYAHHQAHELQGVDDRECGDRRLQFVPEECDTDVEHLLQVDVTPPHSLCATNAQRCNTRHEGLGRSHSMGVDQKLRGASCPVRGARQPHRQRHDVEVVGHPEPDQRPEQEERRVTCAHDSDPRTPGVPPKPQK